MKHLATFVVVACVVVVAACGPDIVEMNDTYRSEIEEAWTQREARLVADDGWLTLVGLYWLEPGIQVVGSSPEAAVRLPDAAPPVVGTLELTGDGRVVFSAQGGAEITVNGGPAVTGVLKTDASGKPDVVEAGRISFYLIARGDRIGVRVKDPQAATRQEFTGLEHFPIDPAFRVTASLEPYGEPRMVSIPTVIGTPQVMLAPGVLHFELAGRACMLEPYHSTPDDTELFIVFRDATSGDTTYGAGRFLSAVLAPGATEVVLDFNLAVNPPCAFTPYATCPLPTPENVLPVAVEAGEKYAGARH